MIYIFISNLLVSCFSETTTLIAVGATGQPLSPKRDTTTAEAAHDVLQGAETLGAICMVKSKRTELLMPLNVASI